MFNSALIYTNNRKNVDGISYKANATYNADAHTALPEIFSNYTNLSNEWHTFGFEWTPTEMNAYIDGICYASLDITNNNSFADDATVDANTYDTKTTDGVNGAGCVEFNSSYSSSKRVIDYFRLYQDPTMNDGGVITVPNRFYIQVFGQNIN